MKQSLLGLKALLRLAFENLQQQRAFGDFDGLRVDVHAVNVVQQNSLALAGGEPPFARGVLVKFLLALLRLVVAVLLSLPVKQVLVVLQR